MGTLLGLRLGVPLRSFTPFAEHAHRGDTPDYAVWLAGRLPGHGAKSRGAYPLGIEPTVKLRLTMDGMGSGSNDYRLRPISMDGQGFMRGHCSPTGCNPGQRDGSGCAQPTKWKSRKTVAYRGLYVAFMSHGVAGTAGKSAQKLGNRG